MPQALTMASLCQAQAGHRGMGAEVDLVPGELTFNRAHELWMQGQCKELAREGHR